MAMLNSCKKPEVGTVGARPLILRLCPLPLIDQAPKSSKLIIISNLVRPIMEPQLRLLLTDQKEDKVIRVILTFGTSPNKLKHPKSDMTN